MGAELSYCPAEVGWTSCPLSHPGAQGPNPTFCSPSAAPKAWLSDNSVSADQLEKHGKYSWG